MPWHIDLQCKGMRRSRNYLIYDEYLHSRSVIRTILR
uniref:Uncharacterized protein n=1 Tax=Anguilla anguilla TaxID=7936 RepID=A0A0E9RDB6_ANGAN